MFPSLVGTRFALFQLVPIKFLFHNEKEHFQNFSFKKIFIGSAPSSIYTSENYLRLKYYFKIIWRTYLSCQKEFKEFVSLREICVWFIRIALHLSNGLCYNNKVFGVFHIDSHSIYLHINSVVLTSHLCSRNPDLDQRYPGDEVDATYAFITWQP